MSDTARRIYLLDSSNYVFRAFHSTNPKDRYSTGLSTSAGMPTNAILVFTNMLRKLLREHRPTHFAAVWDPRGDRGFRREKFAEYKANRKETPTDLVQQFPYFKPILTGMGIECIEVPGFEADDVIATLAKRADEDGWEAVVVSSDKDLYQLLNDNVRMYDGMKERWIDMPLVHKKFGVDPGLVVQVQALVGDSVDNIPGVPGVGPKTAAKLVNQYGSLEGIYEHIGEIKGKLKERLIDNKDSAFMSRDLAFLVDDIPLSETLEHFKRKDEDAEALIPIFHELEFKALLREYQRTAQPTRETKRHTVTSWADLRALTAQLSVADAFAFEVLPDRPEYVQAQVCGLAIATDPYESWYIPLGHRYLGMPDQLPVGPVLGELTPFLTAGKDRRAHGHKEQTVVLRRSGVPIDGVTWDVELMSYLANATKYAHTLDNIALDLADLRLPEPPAAVAKKRETWVQAPVEHAATYAQARAEAVMRLTNALKPELADGAHEELMQMELELAQVLARMEEVGVFVDRDVLGQLSSEFGEKQAALERSCHELAGIQFNLGSPKQLADVLFNRLQLPVIKKTKTGPSTDASVLDQLMDKHPLVGALLDWRSVTKLKSTYTDVLPLLINPETGRVHTNLRQAVAATGRLSSFEPNLQNIPIRTEAGRRIRDAFVAPDGHVLMSADYSQIELRVLAHLTADVGLVAAFSSDVDIHTRTAGEVFGVPAEDVTREQRSAAKAINFGLMYGMGAFRLGRDLHISREQAQEYIDRYFERFPAVKGYMDQTMAFGREHGYVETIMGRRRYVPELRSRNFARRASAERAAINAPVQGTAADLIKLAMLKIDKRLRADSHQTKMLLQVHDELLFEVPHSEIGTVESMVVSEMESVYELRVPLRVSAGHGNNWNEAH